MSEVKLIAWTKPEGEYGALSPEEFIIAQARISNEGNRLNTETMPRLLKYLIQHKHWSPFDLVNLSFQIYTSRAISAQILRHRSIAWQELSQRYAERHSLEPIELRLQTKDRKQSGDELIDPRTQIQSPESPMETMEINDAVKLVTTEVFHLYQSLLKAGVARETARMILPMATSTEVIGNGSIRSWMSFLNTRLDIHAQKECRDIARKIANYICEMFPNLANTTNNFNNFSGNFM